MKKILQFIKKIFYKDYYYPFDIVKIKGKQYIKNGNQFQCIYCLYLQNYRLVPIRKKGKVIKIKLDGKDCHCSNCKQL